MSIYHNRGDKTATPKKRENCGLTTIISQTTEFPILTYPPFMLPLTPNPKSGLQRAESVKLEREVIGTLLVSENRVKKGSGLLSSEREESHKMPNAHLT